MRYEKLPAKTYFSFEIYSRPHHDTGHDPRGDREIYVTI